MDKFGVSKLHGFIIKVYAGEYPNSDIIEVYKWSGYKLHQFTKWMWYFDYRTALLRVKYPRNYIRAVKFDEPLTPKSEKEILKSRISSQKGQVTKIKNAIRKAKQHWDYLFPIEDEDSYKRAIVKLEEAEKKLKELIKLYEDDTTRNIQRHAEDAQ